MIKRGMSFDFFAEPFLEFACPLAFVPERIAESPAMASVGIGMYRRLDLIADQSIEIVQAVGRGTALSSEESMMKAFGVSGVTWSSLENFLTSSSDGLSPIRFVLDPM